MSTEKNHDSPSPDGPVDAINEDNQLIDMEEKVSEPQEGSRLDATFPTEQ